MQSILDLKERKDGGILDRRSLEIGGGSPESGAGREADPGSRVQEVAGDEEAALGGADLGWLAGEVG